MLWILFTVLAAVLWMSADLLSKFVLDKEVSDGVLAAGTVGISQFIPTALVPLFFAKIVFSPGIAIPSLVVGVFYAAGILSYYLGIGKEEVSRFIPALSMTTIFTAIMAFFAIGESFTAPVYIGIIAVVIGTIMISLKNLNHFQSLRGLSFGIIAAILFASRNISLKFATLNSSLWQILFWVGVGGSLTSACFLYARKSEIRKNVRGGEHLFEIGIICAIAYFAYAKAISLGPVSLASAVLKVKILLVFIGSAVISRLHPEIMHEKIDRRILIQKIIAIVLVIVGVVLIQLYF